MKKIFIYYSLSGNGDVVANYLKEKKVTISKVIPEKQLPNNMVLRIIKGGFLAGINHKDKLVDFNNDVSDYDEVIIGSPIWNGKLSCPINTVLDSLDLKEKKITFILYSGSGEAPKTEEILKERFKTCRIIHLKEPKNNREVLSEVLKNI